MLKVLCPEDLETALLVSEDEGQMCLASLVRCLGHLHHFFEGGEQPVVVSLGRDAFERGGLVRNFAWGACRGEEYFYNGGLNYCRSTGEWSINS